MAGAAGQGHAPSGGRARRALPHEAHGVQPSTCEADTVPAPTPEAGLSSGLAALTLLQCLPKGRKIDLIIRQATEAGVSRIVLLESERSVARASEDAGENEAPGESGSGGAPAERQPLPSIEAPRPLVSLRDAAGEWGTALFFHEELLSDGTLHELLTGPVERISILIGPEGGLSPLGGRPAWRRGLPFGVPGKNGAAC